MRGNFQLDGVWYKSAKDTLPTQQVANQAAAKIGQGNSEYGDMTTWSAWIQEDWREGVGIIKPSRNGGFLYGEVESRVPEQLILSPRIVQVDKASSSTLGRFMPADMAATNTIAVGAKRAMMFTTSGNSASNAEVAVWFYCRAPVGTTLTFQVYGNTSGLPNSTLHATGTTVVQESSKGFYWHGSVLTASLANGTNHWVAISADASIEVVASTSGYSTQSAAWDGSSWSYVGNYTHFATSTYGLIGGTSTSTGSGFFRFYNDTQSDLYCWSMARIYKYDEPNDQWDVVGDSGNSRIANAVVFLDQVYLTLGNSNTRESLLTNSFLMQTDETFVDSGEVITYATNDGGRLWIASKNIISYSRDGTVFTNYDTMNLTTDTFVTGMAGLGENMFISTPEGLYRIAPGDFLVPVARWGSTHDDNGRSMVEFEGNLYITADNRIYRITPDLQRQDVWMTRDDDLIAGRIGKVQSLAVSTNYLLAIVSDGGEGSKPTVWAMAGSSWHHVATLPDSPLDADAELVNYSMYYDADTNYLWVITPQRITYRIYLANTTINPFNDVFSEYMLWGWIEWDWFDSTIREADKDYESVAIVAENVTADRPILVYWQDDDSTNWELLGTIDSNYEELIWPDGTRPNTKRFKLGLLINTEDGTETPRIRAIRVKYSLNIRDWFRWSLVIDVSGRTGNLQRMLDGDVNTLTAAQIKDNLDALVAATPPLVYQDVDGTEYDVRVTNADFYYTKQEYIDQTDTHYWEGSYRITLEQVRPGANA